MDILLPTWLKMAKVGFRPLNTTGLSRPEFNGIMRTSALGGDRLAASLEFTPTATSSVESEMERATLIAFLAELEGQQNRAYLTNPARRLRGSFPASEVFTNNTFSNGSTGWTGQQATLTVSDRSLRTTVAKNTSSGPAGFQQTPAVTAYAPYALRGFLGARSKAGLSAGTYADGVENYSTDAAGMITQIFVPLGSTALCYPVVFDTAENVSITGDWIECPYASLSRCALVDNSPNALLNSDDFTTTWANTRTTDAANSLVAPDGTTTADSIIEDGTASNTHFISQGATVATAAANYCFVVALKAGTRGFARVTLIESTSSHECYVDVNLTTGALGTPAVSGANWTNPRAFAVALGQSGWFAFAIVGYKASAGTTITAKINLASALGTVSYSGDGASLIYAWRGTLAASAVPVRLTQTVGTAAASGTAQTGRALYLKGLPVSTNGLLKKGDEVEVITSYGSELKIVTEALNSDAAGRGYLQFKPLLRGTVSDNAGVIIHEPMGKFIFTGDATGWQHEPGIITTASADFEEAA